MKPTPLTHIEYYKTASTAIRLVFRVSGPDSNYPRFESAFRGGLERRKDLQGFNPELTGELLKFDYTTLPGVAEGFDKVVGLALSEVANERSVGRVQT